MDENKKQTIVAFVRLICMLVTSAATLFGVAVDADVLFIAIMCLCSLATIIWGWWKNNNVTKAATEAQELLDMIKGMIKGMKGAADPMDLRDAEEV